MRVSWQTALALLLGPAAILIAGCGGRVSAFSPTAQASLSIHAAVTHLDTSKTTRLTASLDNGDPAQVVASEAEIHYLLGVLKHYFPRWRDLGQSDVLDSFAGLRVLPRRAGCGRERRILRPLEPGEASVH